MTSELKQQIAGLSPEERALLEERLFGESVPAERPAIGRGSPGPAPLSFAQQRLWFLDRLYPGRSLYNIAEAFRMRGVLDVVALERALQEIVRRHEVLRTVFVESGGQPMQEVRGEGISLAVTDLASVPASRREAEAGELAAAEAEAPFDMACGPLIRARLLRLSPDEHWFLLTMHHIVSDAWSMGVLFRELGQLYGSFRLGRASPLAEPGIQYADYAVWQRDWLRGAVLDSQLSYWREKLEGGPALLALPMDRPRPPVQTFPGASHTVKVSRDLTQGLREISRRHNATLFMTLLAAFQAFLYRYSGQDDLLIGTPIAGRNRVETEALIGFFVNTLVLRGNVSGDLSFEDVLERTRETALDAFANQDIPFEKLVEELKPERSLAQTPFFQVMFEFDETPDDRPELPGLEVTSVDLPEPESKFDLHLLATAEAEGLQLWFKYKPDLFDEATISRMASHFGNLLGGVVADPRCAVSRLPLLSEAETRQILVEWNRTEAEYPRDKCVHTLFEEQAARTPDAIAVEFEGETLSYQQLDRRANQLAHYLRRIGVGPDSLVGICVPRSIEMLVGVVGVMKAGGAYVPLDPTYPSQRLSDMMKDSGVSVLLSVEALLDGLPVFGGRIVLLDAERDSTSGFDGDVRPDDVGPDNLAYVIYTSGSTGRPKGVMIPHRAVVNYLTWCVGAYGIEMGRGSVVQSSLSFDLTVTGLLAPLLVGRTVRLLPEGFAPETLGNVLRGERDFSLVKITPARLDLLTQRLAPEDAAGRTRAFVIGGEPLSAESLAFWRDFASDTALFNEYGPTETTVGCSVHRVSPGDPRTGPVPIGRPIANTQLFILDRNRQPAPIGVKGELYVGGAGVGRGYWNQPELTAERFLPNPFSPRSGDRLYRTGDLARYRADGCVEFLGREDGQVKIRGFRVELGEIEARIREHSFVRDAAVVLREDSPGDRRLVAYVVPRTDLPWSLESLRYALRDHLPEYMVPSAFLRLESLPVTRNGKVDRSALPRPDWKQRQLERGYEQPRDALELHLTKVWETVLQAAPIGLDDDFFDLGGHSLLALRLFAEIEKATSRRLPLATLFRAPTVRQIAEVLRERGWSSPWVSLVPIQPRGTRPPFFCVHAAGGSVLPYRTLSTHLGPDQPLYGLQARGLDDANAVPERVEDMAAEYVAEMQSLQPEGPYYIGGHSAGGLVAFEMARRLGARNVAFVALFDTWAPGHGQLIPQKFMRLKFDQLRMRLVRFFRRLTQEDALAYLSEKLAIRFRVLLGRTSDVPPRLLELVAAIKEAAGDYRPGPYEGSVILFRAERQPSEYALDRSLGWRDLALGGVEVHEVPGQHGDLIMGEPESTALAGRLRECLDRAIEGQNVLSSPPAPGGRVHSQDRPLRTG